MRGLQSRAFQGAHVSPVMTSAQATSGPAYSFTSFAMPVTVGFATTGEVGPGTLGILAVYACSGATARTIDSVTAQTTSGAVSLTVTELVKLDGIANFVGLYAVDLNGHEASGMLLIDVTVTLSGTVTNGVALLGTCITGVDWPASYNTNSASGASTDPITATVTYNGRGIMFWAATANNTTGSQAWFTSVNGTERAPGSEAGLDPRQITYGSRTHMLAFLSRYNYTDATWSGLENLGLDAAGTFTLGANYSSDGVSASSGTVSNARLLCVAID